MNKIVCINNPEIISAQLAMRIKEMNKTQINITEDTGINQSQVSRIVSGRFSLCSKNVRKLCKYANIEVVECDSNTIWNKKLMKVLNSAWDGTEEHAKAITQILLAVGAIRKST